MATIINTQPAERQETSGIVGMIIGLIILFLAAYLFFIYGVPFIRNISNPQVNVPRQIDVNINE